MNGGQIIINYEMEGLLCIMFFCSFLVDFIPQPQYLHICPIKEEKMYFFNELQNYRHDYNV